MQKNISDLNNRAWYRLIKVLFVFLFFAITGITIFFICSFNQYAITLDQENTEIFCNYGNKRVFNLEELGIYLTKEDVDDFNKSPEWMKKYREGEDANEYISDYRHDYLDNKKTEIKTWCNISEEENNEWTTAVQKYINGEDTLKPKYFWDINPAYKEKGGFITIVGFSFIAITIIAAIFELARRLFYYIVLGSFRTRK